MIAIASLSTPKDQLLYLIIPGLVLFSFSIFVGWQTYLQSKNFISLTIINQSIQLLGIYIGGYGYEYISGAAIGFTIDLTDQLLLGLNFHLSTLNYKLNLAPDKYFFSFNFIAIYIIYQVEKIKTIMSKSESFKEKHNA